MHALARLQVFPAIMVTVELVSLANFGARISGVMFNDYLVSGAGVGAHASLVRVPDSVLWDNCIKVSWRECARSYLLGHLDCESSLVLSPFLMRSSLVATG